MMARPVILASGGTGGHMFPAVALAGALLGRGYTLALFSDARGVRYGAIPPAVATYEIPSASPSGSMARKAMAALALLRGTFKARGLFKRLDPAAIVGFGSYASAPTLAAAAFEKRPIVLHEQNAVLGRANRLWARAASAIATSFENVAGTPANKRMVLTGNPVRSDIVDAAGTAYAPPRPGGALNVLILGGSQGARIFSDVVPGAVARLSPDRRARLRLSQQCRPEDLDRVRAAYDALGLKPTLATFFDDVPARLADTHLVVSRSGASTVAELAIAGRPAILVPYKHAMDDHQRANARAFEESGAAWRIDQDDFDSAALAARLNDLLDDPAPLAEAAEKARTLGHADAAERLADLVESVLSKGEDVR